MSDWVDVAAVEDFPPGACRVLHIDDAAIAVVNVAGRCHAIEDVCSHDGAALIGGGRRRASSVYRGRRDHLPPPRGPFLPQDRSGPQPPGLRTHPHLPHSHRRRHGAGARRPLGLNPSSSSQARLSGGNGRQGLGVNLQAQARPVRKSPCVQGPGMTEHQTF